MPVKILMTALSIALVAPGAHASGRRDEQDAARRAMLEQRVMPYQILKPRVDREMGVATFIGPEFFPEDARYRMKYLKDGRVVWVDVDGRTGDIIGRSR